MSQYSPKVARKREPPPFSRDDGPYSGMRDSADLTTSKQSNKASLLQNVYPQDAEKGGGCIGRPGFRLFGTQLGAGGARIVQGIYQFSKKNGTQFTIVICGGKFYTLNWVTRVSTEVISSVDLAGAAITLSTTARVSFNTLADVVEISDGINTPFTWNGTAHGGLTKLVNSPVLYGPLTTYYAKAFGIKAVDRLTMVWCEENDPTIGYDTGAYDDKWTIGQSDPRQLTTLLGTNAALNVFRSESSTAVTGAVDATFRSSGTRDGNETIGSNSPWAVLSRDERVFFLDRYGRPHVGSSGGKWEDELWEDFRETLRAINLGALEKAMVVDYTPASLVIFGLVEQGQTDCSIYLVVRVHDDGAEAAAVWRGWTSSYMAMVSDDQGNPIFMHGDANGNIYDHGNPGGTLWDDYLGTSTVIPILHAVETGALMADTKYEKTFDRLDLVLRSNSDMHATVQLVGPNEASPSLPIVLSGGQALWDVAVWDVSMWSPTTVEFHLDAGFSLTQRWAKARISHQQLGEQFGLLAVNISGLVLGTGPEVR
jgi:hypothetical protein